MGKGSRGSGWSELGRFVSGRKKERNNRCRSDGSESKWEGVTGWKELGRIRGGHVLKESEKGRSKKGRKETDEEHMFISSWEKKEKNKWFGYWNKVKSGRGKRRKRETDEESRWISSSKKILKKGKMKRNEKWREWREYNVIVLKESNKKRKKRKNKENEWTEQMDFLLKNI